MIAARGFMTLPGDERTKAKKLTSKMCKPSENDDIGFRIQRQNAVEILKPKKVSETTKRGC